MYAAGRKKSTHEVKYIFFENIIYGVDFFRLVASSPIRILITRGSIKENPQDFHPRSLIAFLNV